MASSDPENYGIAMIGAAGAGKTSLTFDLCDAVSSNDYEPSTGITYTTTSEIDGKTCYLLLHDTPGTDEFPIIREAAIRSAQGIFTGILRACETFPQRSLAPVLETLIQETCRSFLLYYTHLSLQKSIAHCPCRKQKRRV
ncbi:hypothetical protein BDV97DRAFT_412312 [Delphinella strobiligena]|nr:hypothetical protein BDV97DRAFT_412312 [Delphinella strobiligena]